MRDKISKARGVTVTKSHLLWANIPLRYWQSTVNKASVEACAFLKEFFPVMDKWINSGDGLMFHGEYATGKSSLAVIVAKEVIRHGGIVTFIPAARLMDYIVKDMRVAGQEETILERAARSNLVLLDDLGSETFSSGPAGAACLEGTLRQWYDNLISVLFTTNLSYDAIEKRYQSGIGTMFQRLVKRAVALKTPSSSKIPVE